MIDRQKLEAVLSRRFTGASHWQIAAAANAIMGLENEWEEVTTFDDFLDDFPRRSVEFRVFRRRSE
jgi:hypothetical protein